LGSAFSTRIHQIQIFPTKKRYQNNLENIKELGDGVRGVAVRVTLAHVLEDVLDRLLAAAVGTPHNLTFQIKISKLESFQIVQKNSAAIGTV